MVRQLDLMDEIGTIAEEKGLVEVYAYHCYRCNYTWLPRDFDFDWHPSLKKDVKRDHWGEDLLDREAPKSCARCKSRYWRTQIPNRKLKLHPFLKDEKWINEKTINDIQSITNYPWINSVARLRALKRQGKLTPKDILQC